MLTLDQGTLALLGGVVVPILTALVVKAHLSGAGKAIVNAFLASVAGALAVIVPDQGYTWQTLAMGIGLSFVLSVATYFGLWSPTGVTGGVANATANLGIGKKRPV
jgi:hypothetical protein